MWERPFPPHPSPEFLLFPKAAEIIWLLCGTRQSAKHQLKCLEPYTKYFKTLFLFLSWCPAMTIVVFKAIPNSPARQSKEKKREEEGGEKPYGDL